MASESGHSTGASGVSPDELHRVLRALEQAEDRLAAMERQLAHAERLATMGTLVGAVAHEFNNLLTPIMSYAQLALGEPDDAELTRKALERAYKGAERAARVSATMLGFSRHGEEPQACLVRDAARIAIETARLDSAYERITVQVDVPSDLCAGIAGLSLQQVLVNLLLNARHAISPDAGTIRIVGGCSTWNEDGDEREGCRIVVSDTGCGIEPARLDTLFTPYQSGPPRNGRTGTGLGLSICKRLVESVGGTIRVESSAGKGSSFTLELPQGDAALLEQRAGSSAA